MWRAAGLAGGAARRVAQVAARQGSTYRGIHTTTRRCAANDTAAEPVDLIEEEVALDDKGRRPTKTKTRISRQTTTLLHALPEYPGDGVALQPLTAIRSKVAKKKAAETLATTIERTDEADATPHDPQHSQLARTPTKSTRKQRQMTVNVADLPTHAVGPDGVAAEALSISDDATKSTARVLGLSEEEVLSLQRNAPRALETAGGVVDGVAVGKPWPELARNVLRTMARFPYCIVLTRVGNFYESYFEQAPLLAGLLDIKLTSRTWGDRTTAMAGFPIGQLEKYLKALVLDHRRLVAINDEFADVTRDKFDRKVTRVVSPGTLIDETFIDPFSSNWVLSISRVAKHGGDFSYGLAWLDVGTADFGTTICDDAQSLRDEVARLAPVELVLEPQQFTEHVRAKPNPDADAYQTNDHGTLRDGDFVTLDGPLWDAIDASKVHVSFSRASMSDKQHTSTGEQAESNAVANLTAHVQTRLLDVELHNVDALTGTGDAVRRRRDSVLTIDASTLHALEITTSQRGDEAAAYNRLSLAHSQKGSLLSHVRRTVTKGGARLLAQWLTSPSSSLPLIHRRQALVALFLAHPFTTEDVRILLRQKAGDISRALQRILTRRSDVHDLLEVRDFIKLCSDTVTRLRQELATMGEEAEHVDGRAALGRLLDSFEDLGALGERLGNAIDEGVMEKRVRLQEEQLREAEEQVQSEHASMTMRKKQQATAVSSTSDKDAATWGPPFEHMIRPSVSDQLHKLTKEHTRLRKAAFTLEQELKQQYDGKLTLKFMLGQGYVVHVPKRAKTVEALKEAKVHVSSESKTAMTFYDERFRNIGHRLGRLVAEMEQQETVALERLRFDVLAELRKLRRNAAAMNELDVLAGFATLARDLNLVRPTVHDGDELTIEAGRHLGVEQSLLQQQRGHNAAPAARPFTPNDVRMGADSRLHFITGPNMGGKSTLLRMVAIVAILAQVGSFVPARRCSIGVVDQIFSRIGAHDAIHADRSTFMVEMLEVAQFLQRSTKRSLVLCDEVGRGTDNATGTALAHATAQHLVQTVQCKCLFATHLHGVGDMLYGTPGVEYFCTDLHEDDCGENVFFSHRLRRGLNRQSHGLSVARLAGIPDDVLAQAKRTMEVLQQQQARQSAAPPHAASLSIASHSPVIYK